MWRVCVLCYSGYIIYRTSFDCFKSGGEDVFGTYKYADDSRSGCISPRVRNESVMSLGSDVGAGSEKDPLEVMEEYDMVAGATSLRKLDHSSSLTGMVSSGRLGAMDVKRRSVSSNHINMTGDGGGTDPPSLTKGSSSINIPLTLLDEDDVYYGYIEWLSPFLCAMHSRNNAVIRVAAKYLRKLIEEKLLALPTGISTMNIESPLDTLILCICSLTTSVVDKHCSDLCGILHAAVRVTTSSDDKLDNGTLHQVLRFMNGLMKALGSKVCVCVSLIKIEKEIVDSD